MSKSILDEPHAAVPAAVDGANTPRRTMKLISCIVRPERLEAVKEALDQLELIKGMTVTDIRGFGRQKGQVEHYRGGEYRIRFVPKIKIEIAANAEDVERIMTSVKKAAWTGQVGDGKIFVLEMRDVLRIRTGEQGVIAL